MRAIRDPARPRTVDAAVASLRPLLVVGDRRSIAQSGRAMALVQGDRSLVAALAALTSDDDPLVVQRAADLLEKLAFDQNEWVRRHKRVFIGPLADNDRWEVRLQVVRALPLFDWTPTQRRRVIEILRRDVDHPQTFVRAWALDSLATFAQRDARLLPTVRRYLRAFARSGSKALAARAAQITTRVPDVRRGHRQERSPPVDVISTARHHARGALTRLSDR